MTLGIKWLVVLSILFFSNTASACPSVSNFCDDAYYLIRNPKSGLVLDASNGLVTIQHFDGFTPQLWKFKIASLPGLFHIINKSTSKVLDVDKSNGNRLVLREENGSLSQQWYLHFTNHIINGDDSKKVVDIQGGQFTAGNPVIAYNYNGTPAQEFMIKEKLTCCPSVCSNTTVY